MPQPVLDDMAGGFLTIENTGDENDLLLSVTSGLADRVELHRTTKGQMRQVRSLPVPAGGELVLRRGGDHLMFLGLKRKPLAGEEVSLKLRFREHAPITVSVPVKETNHTGTPSGTHQHHGE